MKCVHYTAIAIGFNAIYLSLFHIPKYSYIQTINCVTVIGFFKLLHHTMDIYLFTREMFQDGLLTCYSQL